MNSIKVPLYKWLSVSTLIVLTDQLTKQLIEHSFQLYERLAIMPFFNLTLAYNEGAAFSFLSDAGGWQRWFFLILTSIISVVLFFWLKKSQYKIESLALSFILGGAIGNFIDRFLFGHVIDFLDVYYKTHHFPAFNVADMAISGGVMLLIVTTFLQQPDKKEH
ncbi:MAG: signal peptidase II [Gammaproteobacteria bacterium]|nr:signal peptidase II [Gammaproteobacteria bacterium]